MQTSRQTVSPATARRQVPAAASRDSEPKQPAAPDNAIDAPQPIDAELLQHVGGAGLGYAPVNRW